MKKILSVLVLSLIPCGIFAQGLISFGPKVGWNSTKLTTDYKEYVNDLKSGFQGGLFFSLYLKKLYIQPEAYFSLKRGALHSSIDPLNPGSSLDIQQAVSLSSVDVPIILGYKLLDLKVARLRVCAGPVASFLLSKEFSLTVNGLNETEKVTREDFKDPVWSAQIGAGLDVLMFTFDVGYQFGVDKFLTVPSLDDFGLRNMFYCSLGWRLL